MELFHSVRTSFSFFVLFLVYVTLKWQLWVRMFKQKYTLKNHFKKHFHLPRWREGGGGNYISQSRINNQHHTHTICLFTIIQLQAVQRDQLDPTGLLD